MPTDSSDLTFVRCPSCRSLVPAVSTRCRMCGASLESTSEPDLDQIEKPVKPEAVESRVAKEVEVPVDDPLSAYIEEVEVDLATEETEEEETEALDEYVEESEPEPILHSEPVSEPISEEPRFEREEPKVIVERGVARGARHGLSFSGRPSRAHDVKQQSEQVQQQQAKSNRAPQTEEGDQSGEERAVVPESVDSERTERRPSEKTAVSSKPEQTITGRLFGWLVSYRDPQGEAIELREGKFFISSTRIKPTDLLIKDSSISSPHVIVDCSAARGLRLQDLLSEHGVYVRRRGASEYVREEQVFQIENGDWVKLGLVEFLVTLVPQVGAE